MADIDTLLTEAKDAGTYLVGEGHVDEGVAVELLIAELVRLRNEIKSGKPICPHCMTQMEPRKYVGYYDEFYHWECQCDPLPGAKVHKGSYA